MSKLNPQLDAIRIEYDLRVDDFWELPQRKGTWIARHSALEKVAAKAHIQFDAPQVVESDAKNGIASMVVRGFIANDPQRQAWATGEASPANNKNSYPWAIAEKRSKDRVILKLIGIEAYSEDEADDFKQNASQGHTDASGGVLVTPVLDSIAKLVFPVLQSNLRACATKEQLDGAAERWQPQIEGWSNSMLENVDQVYQEMVAYLKEHDGDARSANREVIEADLRASVSEADLNSRWSGWGPAMKKLAPADVAKLQAVAREVRAAANKAAPDFTQLAPNDIDPKPTHAQKVAATP